MTYILLSIYASPHYFAELYHIPDAFRLKILYNVSFASFIILLVSHLFFLIAIITENVSIYLQTI